MLTDDGTCWVNLGDSYYNYRLKGQGLPKQSVSKLNKTYQICVLAEAIESKDLKEKRFNWNPLAFLPSQ